MNFAVLDKTSPTKPLDGLEIVRWFGDIGSLKMALRAFLTKRALVCTSPNRSERCDVPATGIFWQDGMEWYPCCDAHYQSQGQWSGNTRFRGHHVSFLCFRERCDSTDEEGAAKVQQYDRTDAA
jgi:hypothetical protein